MQGQSDVKLSVDPKTNALVVVARPAQQATIKAVLDEMQNQGQRIEVIRLARVDPQVAVASLSKLFGLGDATKTATGGLQIDADPATRQLMIRGNEAQIAQIRGYLQQLGENLTPGRSGQGGKVRTLPMSSAAANSILEQIQAVWPRANKIRVVGPSAVSPSRPTESPHIPKTSSSLMRSNSRRFGETCSIACNGRSRRRLRRPSTNANPNGSQPPAPSVASDERSAGLLNGAHVVFVAERSRGQNAGRA